MSDQRTYGGLTCHDVRELAGSFVLGALEPDEAAAVREHLADCPEVHEEIAQLGGVLPALAASVPVAEPPDGLKARIMAAAAADLAERTSAAGTAPRTTVEPAPSLAAAPSAAAPAAPAAAPIAFPGPAERETRRRGTSATSWVLRIAAVVAIVALGASTLVLRNQLDAADAYEQSVAQVLDVAAQPGSLTAILTADGGTGSGLAAIDSSGKVTLAMQDLAATSGNQVYEAWVIGGDGVPVPLGSFAVGNAGTASFVASGLPTTSGVVLALTLEPGPGAQTPTLPIISKGVATEAA
jgi:anti-sigma-K factor RskA